MVDGALGMAYGVVSNSLLLAAGLLILWKMVRGVHGGRPVRHVSILGLAGGFCDAIGGGGWGPVVTSTLVARGHDPRMSIASVNLAEWFVTVSTSIVFMLTIGLSNWPTILALIVGGVIAAPMAAYATRLIPARPLMGLVGLLIVATSLRTIILAWF